MRGRPPEGNANTVYAALKAQGLLVRFFDEPTLRDKLRITIGTDEQNDQLVTALTHVLVDAGSGYGLDHVVRARHR